MRVRTRFTRLASALAVLLVSFTATRSVSAQSWYANLSPEVPGATGSGYGTFSINGSMLTIDVDWTGLGGVTTVAHIHCCTSSPRSGTAGVAVTTPTLTGFPTGVSAGSYFKEFNLMDPASFNVAFSSGYVNLEAAQMALVDGFNNGTAYLNIHTNEFPAGEIRGFITQVPEPATWMLTVFGAAMLLVASIGRRQHVSAAGL